MSTRIAKGAASMRKTPRQARSRALVEAILEAGARILSVEGWAGFTTNAVAERAGVSIGSLYQYFPDKLALTDAIRQRHLDDCMAVLRLSQDAALSSDAFAAGLARAMISAHLKHPGLHRVLLDEAPASSDYRNPQSAFEQAYLACFEAAVARYRGEANRVAALVLSDAIDGIVHNAARRGMLAEPEVERELVAVVLASLALRTRSSS
ncbi:TetR/AcrR family transcriptional regulator [Rhizobium rhizosphaerae]|nr:TetR/AcrR family transcriptional regulator [Xaviernesmea rhizosphaerae]